MAQNFLSAGVQACNSNLAHTVHSLVKESDSSNIVKLLDEIFPTVSEVLTVCWFRKKSLPCDKIFKRILTDFGFCYSFNLLSHEEIFIQDVSNDFDSFKRSETSQWTLHDGYKIDEEEVFPMRASKNSPLTFVVSIECQFQNPLNYL